MEKLTKVIQARYAIQEEQEEQQPSDMYTTSDLIAFAIEEAWQNNELDFITNSK